MDSSKDFYTKKDLQAEHEISDVTVISTMQACGLNTKKKKYTQEEVDRFQLARDLFNEGKTQKEVEEYFASLEQQAFEEETEEQEQEQEFDTSEFIAQHREALGNTINQSLGNTVVDIAEEKARDIAQLVPALVLSALNKELNSEEILEKIRSKKKKKEGGIPDFLLSKMQAIEIKTQPQRLNGKEQKQLPQASQEPSIEEF